MEILCTCGDLPPHNHRVGYGVIDGVYQAIYDMEDVGSIGVNWKDVARALVVDGRPSDLTVIAYGEPASQGSKNVWVTPQGRRNVTESSKGLAPWRSEIIRACREALEAADDSRFPLAGPIEVVVTTTFTRPKGHYRTGRNAHLLRDDAPPRPTGLNTKDPDKLARAVLDPLKSSGVIVDDCRVVDLHIQKVWANEARDALDIPGAVIRIRDLATPRDVADVTTTLPMEGTA